MDTINTPVIIDQLNKYLHYNDRYSLTQAFNPDKTSTGFILREYIEYCYNVYLIKNPAKYPTKYYITPGIQLNWTDKNNNVHSSEWFFDMFAVDKFYQTVSDNISLLSIKFK